jgi:hypothetical protein
MNNDKGKEETPKPKPRAEKHEEKVSLRVL